MPRTRAGLIMGLVLLGGLLVAGTAWRTARSSIAGEPIREER